VTSTDPLGHATTRTYDAVSRLATQTDPLGRLTWYTYDRQTRLAQWRIPPGLPRSLTGPIRAPQPAPMGQLQRATRGVHGNGAGAARALGGLTWRPHPASALDFSLTRPSPVSTLAPDARLGTEAAHG